MTRPDHANDVGVDRSTAAAMLDHTRDALLLLEASGGWVRIAYANRAFGELTRPALDSLPVVDLHALLSPESDPEEIARLSRAVHSGEAAHAMLVLADDEGAPHWVDVDVAPLEWADDTARSVATLREITEQVRRDHLLRVAGWRAHDLLAIVEADGRVTHLEPMQRAVLGHDPDDMVGRSVVELVHADDAAMVREALAAADVDTPLVVRLHHADGSWRWVELHVDDHRGDARIGGLVMAGRDVSGREDAHTELTRTTRQLQMAVAAAELGCWQLDLSDDTVSLDVHAAEQFSTELDAPPMTLDEGLAYVHPDDRDGLGQAIAHAVSERGGFERAFRVASPGMPWRWLLSRAQVVCAVDGTPTQLTGVTLDVTERHTAADRVARTLETLPDAYYALDEQWRFVFLNTPAERLLGHSGTGLLGRPVWEALPPELATVSELGFKRAVATGDEVAFQTYFPPTGAWYEVRVFPDDQGLAVVHRDVTEQVRGDAEQQRLLGAERSARRDAETARAQLAHSTAHDDLTGLANRTEITRSLHRQLAHGPVVVLLIDLDDFKRVNNSLGHAIGDTLLGHVAERITHVCRPPTRVARFGGDEFLVVLDHGDLDEALAMADRLREAIDEPYEPEGSNITLSISVGVALASPDEDAETLIRDADTALWAAKEDGSGRVVVYDHSLYEAARERLETENALRATRHGEQLALHYQPIFELDDGQRVGAEALLRWHHPARGLLFPGAFIDLAETTGLIVPIGEWVIDTACRAIARQRGAGPVGTVWVNVAATQLARCDFARSVIDVKDQHGVGCGELGIELTERALFADSEAAGAQLTQLHQAGVRIAIDDFGTGYSSMSSLQQHPIDVLKIDRSFTARVETPDGEAIVRAIADLAHVLGATASAEGVETEQQLAAVRRAGCDTAAGYLLAYPEPPELPRRDHIEL